MRTDDLAKYITRLCESHINEGDIINSNAEKLEDKYNIPLSEGIELFSLKRVLERESVWTLFCMIDILSPKALDNHFTPEEIKEYSSIKYKIQKLKFPLRLDAIQVSDDQWLSCIDVQELMKLRDAQVIRYNENMQRTMRKVKRGGFEYYKIFVNKKAVDAISESYKNNIYIPNTITFNMGETSSFVYDKENKQLVIKSLENDCFNILDGYHRYLALSNIYTMDKNFDYTMELRITCFDVTRARQFIWQEDQKTKMRKIDSDSLNQQDYTNKIVDYLNLSSDLSGKILLNNGIINAPTFARCIKFAYNDIQKNMIPIRNKLKLNISDMVSNDQDLLTDTWKENFIIAFTLISANEDNFVYDRVIKLYDKIQEITGNTVDNKIKRCIKVYREEM